MASIFRQQFTKKDESGKIIRKRSQYWYIDYKVDKNGTRKRVKGFKDKTATAQYAAKLERDAELEQTGLADRFKEHRQRPLAEHLADFRRSLGETSRHAMQTEHALKKVFDGCKFCQWADISASRFLDYLNSLQNKGISQRTFNFYLKAGKQFCRWMVLDQRAAESPLAHLKTETVTRQVRKRRALALDEIRLLLETTKAQPTRFGVTGYERALLYRLAVETGFRAAELRSLTMSSFDFDNCTVTIEAAYAKNKKTYTLPLKPDTAAEIRTYATGKLPTAGLFSVPEKTAEMLKADLEAAGIEYQDAAGRFADFHSLRHTAGTLLASSGVHPKVAQSIMRHSDINLTMSLYTHTLRGQESEAVAMLPDLAVSSRASEQASGTDGEPIDAYKPAYKKLTKTAYPTGNRLSAIDTTNRAVERVNSADDACDKPISEGQLGNEGTELSLVGSGENKNGRCRIRTCDPLIKSQLLYRLS
jgi:integrase